jgi:hypothetical protein
MYGIISNCNFDAADEVTLARKAVASRRLTDADLVSALDTLEETLEEYADSPYAHAAEACRAAETAVRVEYRRAVAATDAE